MNQNLKILAGDPGSNKVGISCLSLSLGKIELINSNQVYLEGKSLEERLNFLYNYLDKYLSSNPVQEIALEETFVAPFDKKTGNYKFTLDAPLKLSMSRGIIWALAGKYGIKVYEYSNGDVKKAITRNHQASKKMMMNQIGKIFGKKFEEDEADSVAIGVTHLIAKKLSMQKDS
jgi:crossover junction endodeoxyribonuclease RuvC